MTLVLTEKAASLYSETLSAIRELTNACILNKREKQAPEKLVSLVLIGFLCPIPCRIQKKDVECNAGRNRSYSRGSPVNKLKTGRTATLIRNGGNG